MSTCACSKSKKRLHSWSLCSSMCFQRKARKLNQIGGVVKEMEIKDSRIQAQHRQASITLSEGGESENCTPPAHLAQFLRRSPTVVGT